MSDATLTPSLNSYGTRAAAAASTAIASLEADFEGSALGLEQAVTATRLNAAKAAREAIFKRDKAISFSYLVVLA
jgi:hypothetical protein